MTHWLRPRGCGEPVVWRPQLNREQEPHTGQTLASYRPTLQLRGGWQPVKAVGDGDPGRAQKVDGGLKE